MAEALKDKAVVQAAAEAGLKAVLKARQRDLVAGLVTADPAKPFRYGAVIWVWNGEEEYCLIVGTLTPDEIARCSVNGFKKMRALCAEKQSRLTTMEIRNPPELWGGGEKADDDAVIGPSGLTEGEDEALGFCILEECEVLDADEIREMTRDGQLHDFTRRHGAALFGMVA